MSFVSAPRDVRVTAKRSIKSPFIPAELSRVSTHAEEMEKGLSGWTDMNVKLPSTLSAQDKRLAEQRIAEANVGNVIRKAPRRIVRVATAGPTEAQKIAKARALLLAMDN